MAAMDDLNSAVVFLQQAVVDLEARLLTYDPGEFDAEISLQTANVVAVSNAINAIAPMSATAGALELTAVT